MKVLIIGGSSGLGAEMAKQLASQGSTVAIVGRRIEQLEAVKSFQPESILVFQHDVNLRDQIPELFQKICRDLGGLDAIIYAAGVMPEVGIEEFNSLKDIEMIQTNFLGCVCWLNEAADRFLGVKAGTIMGIGSVAGDRGRSGQPVYNATKSAMATYLEALRNRLSRRGINVVTVKPGPMATEMTAHLDSSKMMPVELAAKIAIRSLKKSGEVYLKPTHWLIFLIIRHIPSPIFRRLNI